MFESVMWEYIREEKEVLRNMLKDPSIQLIAQAYKDIECIYIIGHGSSYNAATSVRPALERDCRIPVYVVTPSAFMHTTHSFDWKEKDTTLVIGISQTGTSRGVVESLKMAKAKGCKVLGLTNEKGSPTDTLSDDIIDFHCGIEDSNAKTKGYSCTLLALLLLDLYLAQAKGTISEEQFGVYKKDLEQEVMNLDTVISNITDWCHKNQYGKGMTHIYVLGDGLNFGTSMEGQLKLMETMCIPTMFNDTVEFSHGMHRSITKDSYVILLNDGTEKELVDRTFDYLVNLKAHTIMVTNQDEIGENILSVPKYTYQSSLLSIVAIIQVISVFVPEINGLNPNRNANNDYTDAVKTRV